MPYRKTFMEKRTSRKNQSRKENKMKAFHHMSFAIIIIAVFGLFLCGFSKKAKLQEIIIQSPYQVCMNNCLAFNGYNTDVYYFCKNQCLYPSSVIIVGGGYWFHGVFYHHRYERGFNHGRHYEPRHEGRNHEHNRGR